MDNTMQHVDELTEQFIKCLATGEEFTYKTEGGLYRKGQKIMSGIMIPVGLLCSTVEHAQKQH